MRSIDRWNVTPREGIEIQNALRALVRRRWAGGALARVAGADVHFPSKDRARAAIVILAYPGLELVESSMYESACTFPYVPGLLSFREIPPLLEAWERLHEKPDVVLCDGQGIAHPRGLGLASHLGLALGVPAIGCAKSPLFGTFAEPGPMRGSTSAITHPNGRTIGAVVRTRDGTRPLFVSVGHLIGLRRSISIVLACATRFRIPEPLRAAHHIALARRA